MMFKIVTGGIAIPREEYLTLSTTATGSSNEQKFRHISCSTEGYKNSYFPKQYHIGIN